MGSSIAEITGIEHLDTLWTQEESVRRGQRPLIAPVGKLRATSWEEALDMRETMSIETQIYTIEMRVLVVLCDLCV